MNGVEFIKSLGEDYADSHKELVRIAAENNKTHCIYALTLDGKSLVEGRGLVERSEIVYFTPGETPINHINSFIVATTILLKNGDYKLERAVKLLDSEEVSKSLTKQMHDATKFKQRGERKSVTALKLINAFSEFKNLSPQATAVARLLSFSKYNFFEEVKDAHSLGIIDNDIYNELQTAYGFNF